LPASTRTPSLGPLLHAVALLLAGVALAVVSTLNFSLGVLAALLLGPPLLLARRLPAPISVALCAIAAPSTVAILAGVDVARLVTEWHLCGTWFLPFVSVVVTPLLAQAGLAALL
jgi:hypothetical protein